MGEQKERMLRGEWYLDEPDLAAERDRCGRLLAQFNAAAPDDDATRTRVLRGLFAEVGAGSSIMPPLRCSYGAQVRIGANCAVNFDAIFLDDAAITLGDDVRIGPRAQLLTALHPMDDHELRRAGWERPEPITIGDNAWLGGGVIVCPGVTIGANSVVGAGSVVTRDVPERVFAAGNPARRIREL